MSDAKTVSTPPTLAAALEEFDRESRRSRTVLAWLLIAATLLSTLAFTLPDGPFVFALRRAFGIGIVAWILIIVIPFLFLRINSRPLRRVPPGPIGTTTGEALRAMVAEIAREHPGREQPRVYVMDIDVPNALAVNSLLVNLVGHHNAVYLTRGLLEYLSPDEIRAIYLHEIAHFHRFMYEDTRTKLPLLLCGTYAFTPVALLPDTPWIEWSGAAGAVVAVLFLMGASFGQRTERNIEYLCDHFAAERSGRLTMVNALLRLADGIRASVAKDKGLARMLKKLAGRPTLDWASIDSNVPDHRLDEVEYPRLIAALQAQRDAVIKGSPVDVESDSHPSLASRILFLDANAGPGRLSESRPP
jgi:Zn-dependent protease with chaperone function